MRPFSDLGRGARLGALLVALLAVVASALAFSGSAWAGTISPEAGPTKNAQDIRTLYNVVLAMGAAVVAVVWIVLFYSLFRFRARRGRTAPQIRGNTTLELGWTLGAAGLVLIIAVITFIFLPGIRDPQESGNAALAEARGLRAAVDQPAPEGRALRITVSGQQYLWRYQYPNGAVSFTNMVVPKDVTVLLKIEANDVVHSWWIPQLGGKFDAVPGKTNETWFKATETGTFEGQCAELCGDNHASMVARVTVLELPAYLEWARRQKAEIAEAQRLAQVQRKVIERQQRREAAAARAENEADAAGRVVP
jgi:cytochrome c oxidase subunit 2